MSYQDWLHSTPPEINTKIKAYNDIRRGQEIIAYKIGSLSRMAFAEKFPSLEEAFPTPSGSTAPEIDTDYEEAVAKAKRLGHPVGAF